ncbi:MAG: hypothetical protein M1455_03565 [Actinobacteria bacterium]|nr:hypothetical protein [Actinomycetota bacterium]
MKRHFQRIIISTVALAALITLGILVAHYNVTGATGSGATPADSPIDSNAAGPGNCVEYPSLVGTEDHADGSKTYFYELDGNLLPETVGPGQPEPHPCKTNVTNCAPAATYRIDGGEERELGDCVMLLTGIGIPPNISLQKGEQVEIHMMNRSYSAPVSSEPSVLDRAGQSDDGATSTFVANSSGTALITVRGGCIEDPNNTNGTCLVLQISVP